MPDRYPLLLSSIDINNNVCDIYAENKNNNYEKKIHELLCGEVKFNSNDEEVDFDKFGWVEGPSDRKWWWEVQSLPFLRWFSLGAVRLSGEDKCKADFFVKKSFFRWYELASENDASPLVWHDHASSIRLDNIVLWVNYLICNNEVNNLLTRDEEKKIVLLIKKHVSFMMDEKNYSRRTNHGFEQMLVIYKMVIVWCMPAYLSDAYKVSKRRLIDELDFAFTSEGVHVENSPGYQKFMLSRLHLVKGLSLFGEHDLSGMASQLIEKVNKFLGLITMPNGYLPMIGDTKGGDKSGNHIPYDNGVSFCDYSQSGYYIARGKVATGECVQFICKNSFLSNYHRHDDDLSFHLFYDGNVVFGDGGLGFYNEKDSKRIFLRSTYAHSGISFQNTIPIRKVDNLDQLNTMKVHQPGVVVCESSVYGGRIRRVFDLRYLYDKKIFITDEVLESQVSYGKTIINFFIPNVARFSCLENKLTYKTKNKNTIYINSAIDGRFYIGANKRGDINCRSFVSPSYGLFSKAASIGWEFTTFNNKKITTAIGLDVIINKEDNSNAESFVDGLFQENIRTLNIGSDKNSNENQIYTISYRGFDSIQVMVGGVWCFEDIYPPNVCHHVMSLRWIREIESINIVNKIILSFIKYHSFTKVASKYYLGKQADHTTSIRLSVLRELIGNINDDKSLVRAIRDEISKNINSCLVDTYKEGNNHGLMVDKSILECLIEDSILYATHKDDLLFVLNRINIQLSKMFDDDGFTKEHSTSYQEYNLGIVIDLFEVMKKLTFIRNKNEICVIKRKIDKIKDSSRKALGFLLKSNGEYVCIGDSFPAPKGIILKKAFGNEDPEIALYPESSKEGCFYSKTLGVAVYRDSEMHLVLNGSWHSYVHKQNDDLSIFLRFNDEDVFIDGGYSDIVPLSKVDTRSERSHSTVIPVDVVWKKRGLVNDGNSEIKPPLTNSHNVITFSGEHSRVNEILINRTVTIKLPERIIQINDKLSKCVRTMHRFLLPKHYCIYILSDSVVELRSSLNIIRMTVVNDNVDSLTNRWITDKVLCITNNRKDICVSLDYISNGEAFFEIYLDKITI